MKNKIAVGLLALGLLAVATPSVVAQEEEGDDRVIEKLESIDQVQQEILSRLEAIQAAQEEQKATLEDIQRKQKAYVNPKWTP